MCLDILFFIGYVIEDERPWHSIIGWTYQFFSEYIIEEVFFEKGMVSGHMQTIDSAPIKASTLMDSLER
ncbi:hypothetical protein [Gelidibacter gilvus]|uniref:Uncharacterized protein n=1 Tax=Gelidibacter gilvus TaxID=59602 RepID=A0A4Q0XCU2_9FLAO|nr:hypothetical protein [Gelidibacter gilvus]RXJ43772.1 hypothetical protein ESZ48_18685 [Gelidibacter gilvus]